MEQKSPKQAKESPPTTEEKRKKRTITDIRDFEEDRREDGLYVGARLHLGEMGREPPASTSPWSATAWP